MGNEIKTMNPAVGAGASVLGGILNYFTAKRNTDKTIQANKELAEYQYSKTWKCGTGEMNTTVLWHRWPD